MEIETQEPGRLILRLGEDDIGEWGNALNEVCHGFAAANFEAAIGIRQEIAALLLQKIGAAVPGRPEAFSLEEILAVRNALTTVLAELDVREYSMRMGFTVEESRQMRNALDRLAGQVRFVKTA
jgi:hypothetical protein